MEGEEKCDRHAVDIGFYSGKGVLPIHYIYIVFWRSMNFGFGWVGCLRAKTPPDAIHYIVFQSDKRRQEKSITMDYWEECDEVWRSGAFVFGGVSVRERA